MYIIVAYTHRIEHELCCTFYIYSLFPEVKPFVCSICQENPSLRTGAWQFSQDTSMENHQLKKHGIPLPPTGSSRPKRYICELDGRLFRSEQLADYIQHLKDEHPWHSHLRKLHDGRVIKKS